MCETDTDTDADIVGFVKITIGYIDIRYHGQIIDIVVLVQ